MSSECLWVGSREQTSGNHNFFMVPSCSLLTIVEGTVPNTVYHHVFFRFFFQCIEIFLTIFNVIPWGTSWSSRGIVSPYGLRTMPRLVRLDTFRPISKTKTSIHRSCSPVCRPKIAMLIQFDVLFWGVPNFVSSTLAATVM